MRKSTFTTTLNRISRKLSPPKRSEVVYSRPLLLGCSQGARATIDPRPRNTCVITHQMTEWRYRISIIPSRVVLIASHPTFLLAPGMPVRYDAIWEFGFLEELVGRNNVILQADFDALLHDEEVCLNQER